MPRLAAPIGSRRTFAELHARGRRGASGPVRLRFLEATPEDPARRVAYAIPKKVGVAVVRNRVRRRLRAAVDASIDTMAPGDYLIGADAAAATMGFDDLIKSLRKSLEAAGATREDDT